MQNANYVITKEESKRLGIFKFIAIFLVVYIHSYNERVNLYTGTVSANFPKWLWFAENIISEGFARSAVPALFIISAILMFRKERAYVPLLKNKCKTLLAPYLIWNGVWILFAAIAQILPWTQQLFSSPGEYVWTWEVRDWIKVFTSQPFLYPLWFLRDLMVMALFYPIFQIIIKKAPKVTGILGIAIFIIPFEFTFKIALASFFVGAWIVTSNIKLGVVDKIPYRVITPIYLALVFVKIVTQTYYTEIPCILCGVLFFWKVTKTILYSKFYKNCEVVRNIIPYSFLIYVGHELALTALKKICINLFPTTPVWLFAEYMIVPLIIITGCIFAGMVMHKWTPKLYGILTGQR